MVGAYGRVFVNLIRKLWYNLTHRGIRRGRAADRRHRGGRADLGEIRVERRSMRLD
jgi:hypothetical protein